MLTPFGKTVRKERIERGLMLGDMARALGMSSSLLSQIETGKKTLADSLVRKVIKFFDLNETEQNQLWRDVASSRAMAEMPAIHFTIPESPETFDRELASRLAVGFARMPPAARRTLDRLLKDSVNG